jgi:hypothetical protein
MLMTSENITKPTDDISPQEGRRCLFDHRRQTGHRWHSSGAAIAAAADDDDGDDGHTPPAWGHYGWRQHCYRQSIHDGHVPDPELRNEEDVDIAMDGNEKARRSDPKRKSN